MQTTGVPPAHAAVEAANSPAPEARKRTAAIVATLAATAPMLITAVRYIGRPTVLWGDSAIIDVLTRDVWTRRVPLVGFYGRVGFYYPGPLTYYVTAPVSFVFGHRAWATVVSYALLQALAIAWTARLAWRRAHQLTFVLALLAVDSLAYVALRHFDPLNSPWNPYAAFPFLLLFVLQAWCIGLGDHRQIPWAVGVASFIVQTNVGYGLLVAVAGAWFLFVSYRSTISTGRDEWRRRLKFGMVVGAVLWLPPLFEQLRDQTHGNLYKLAQYFVLGRNLPTLSPFDAVRGKPLGVAEAGRLMATEFRILPPWLGGATETSETYLAKSASAWWLLVPVALLVFGYLAARRHHNRPAQHAVSLVALLSVAGLVSLSTLRDLPDSFDFFWRATLAAMLVAATLGAMLTSSRLWRRPQFRVAVGGVLLVAIVFPVVVTTTHAVEGDPQVTQAGRVVKQLADQVRPSQWARTRIQIRGGSGLTTSLFDELDQRGFRVTVSTTTAELRFGNQHGSKVQDVDQVWFAADGVDVSVLSGTAGAHVVSLISPFDPADEERVRQLQYRLVKQLSEHGRSDLIAFLPLPSVTKTLQGVRGVDETMVRELAAFNATASRERAWRYAIVAFDPTTAPTAYSY